MERNIIPRYANCKNKSYSLAGKISNRKCAKIRLINENKFLYKKKGNLNLQIYHVELQLMNIYGRFWHNVKGHILEKLSDVATKKYQNLNRKLVNLTSNQNYTTTPEQNQFQFENPIRNLSNIQFNNKELNQICYSYKSNIGNNNINDQVENLVVETENIIQNNEKFQNKDAIRYQISRVIEKHIHENKIYKNNRKTNQQIPNNNIKNIIQKVINNNLTINKADKGNIIMIQDKDELKNKVLQFLNNPNYNIIKTDPTNRYQKDLKKHHKILQKND